MPAKPNLFIVDDEPNVTRTLQLIFEREGYRVRTAFSAAEAIAALHNGIKIDGLIADLNMEREDIGLQVAKVAGTLKPRPVIVICTGYATVKNAQQALKLQVDYLATKPVDPQEMTATLHRLLQRRKESLMHKEGLW